MRAGRVIIVECHFYQPFKAAAGMETMCCRGKQQEVVLTFILEKEEPELASIQISEF